MWAYSHPHFYSTWEFFFFFGVIGQHKLRVWEMHALINKRLQYMLLIGTFSAPMNGVWQKKC